MRTTSVGLASSDSRIGAAIVTFAFPILLALNVSIAIAAMAGVCVISALVTQFLARETKGRSLMEVASRPLAFA